MENTSGVSQGLEMFLSPFPPNPSLLMYGERIRFMEKCIKYGIPGLPREFYRIILVILFPLFGLQFPSLPSFSFPVGYNDALFI